jgi:hypothetical protein
LIQTPGQVSETVDKMEQEADSIRHESLKMTWNMRGGVTYSEIMNMSFKERESISKVIKENIEITNKTKMNHI